MGALIGTGCPSDPGQSLRTLDGGIVSVPEVESLVTGAMDKAGVTGLSLAIINDSEIVCSKAFGYRDRDSDLPFEEETVTGAASLSKTVFAYLVMVLADEGVLDLDRPLQEVLQKPLPEYVGYADLAGDDRIGRITPRTVLSHTTGFPNWRFLHPENRLLFMFPPGERFSYSGEGIALLQMVVEEVTGRGLEDLAREKVFKPFGMTRTSYVWRDAFQENHALPHDRFGRTQAYRKRRRAEAAGSMVTTAADYARFLVGMLGAEGTRKTAVERMLEPEIRITSGRMFGPASFEDTDENNGIHLSWCLGWGRFDTPSGRAFFHTGHDLGYQNFTITYPDAGIGIVLLSNSDNFESVAEEIVRRAIGDRHAPFQWLGYEPFDPARDPGEPPPEPVAVEVDREILADYVGRYAWMAGGTIVVKMEGDRLLITTDGQDWTTLFAESEDRFFVEGDDIRFAFVRGEAGRVTGLNLVIQELELPAPRIPE